MSKIIFWEVAGASWLHHLERWGQGDNAMCGHRRLFEPAEHDKTASVGPQSVCGKSVHHSHRQCPLLRFTGHWSRGPVLVCLPPAIKHKYEKILTCCVGRLMLPAHKMCNWKGRSENWSHSKHSKQNLSRMYKSESVLSVPTGWGLIALELHTMTEISTPLKSTGLPPLDMEDW